MCSTEVQTWSTGQCSPIEEVRVVSLVGGVVCEPLPSRLPTTTAEGHANLVGTFSSIAIGSDGLPVISYHDDTDAALKVAKCTSAACTGVAIVSTIDDSISTVGQFTSIAVGSDGLPIISYRDSMAGALRVAKCATSDCNVGAIITAVDDPTNNVGSYTDIAIGTDGLPVISYLDLTAGALRIAKCSDANCIGVAATTAVDGPPSNVGAFTSIAVGVDGLPIVSYYDRTGGDLRVAKCSNNACTGAALIYTVDNSANDVGFDTSIAIGSDGWPVISYYDNTAHALKVAKCGNGACTGTSIITIVDHSANDVGRYTSIAIGSDGLPAISYLDSTAGALKVAKCIDTACAGAAVITTVDDPPQQVGYYSAIAIGTDGHPIISYHDLGFGTLKVARCPNAACTGAATITTVDGPARNTVFDDSFEAAAP